MPPLTNLRALVWKHRELCAFTLVALAVRLFWNLKVHPPTSYAFSDMGGYLERAQTMIDRPDDRIGYFGLFPWGTHTFLSIFKRLFGRDATTSIGVGYAVLGAFSVGTSFQLARRLTRRLWVPRVVAAILVVYYPWIALGGYVLSEPPFTLFLCATALAGLRLADRGRPGDAWLFGVALAIAAAFRPQILAAVPLLAIHALVRRRTWKRLHPGLLWGAFIPLAMVMAYSAARMHWHTGHAGGIAGNGPLNFAFGRCHATTINSNAPDRKGSYSPPSLGALLAHEKEHPGSLIRLDPASDTRLGVVGHMWDAEPMSALASECIRLTGPLRQARYAATHVALLWFYNSIWPDSGQKGFQDAMSVSLALHDCFILPPALVALVLSFRKRRARHALISLHVVALVLVAMVYFGDTRLRAPYDSLLLILAVDVVASAARAGRSAWRARITKPSSPPHAMPDNPPSI